MNAAPSTFRPPGQLEADPLAAYGGPWNARLAAHLARRAGFGASADELARLSAMPMRGAVDSFVRFADVSKLPSAPALPALPLPQRGLFAGAMQAAGSDAAVEARKAYLKELNMQRRAGVVALQTWWLERMVASPAQLQEKMTLFWHTHFTTALGKGITPQELLAQNQLFRGSALGSAHALTLAVAQDPAMLKYLDNAKNDKAHANENFARELMELYTLGRGNYSESDVREGARAFTGWTVRPPRMGGGFVFNARQHDDGTKTFLGQTGNFDGKAVVDIIFAQPAASRWFATKLLQYFVYDDPEPQLVDGVAALLRKNDFETAPVVSTILRSNVFYSDRAYRALVKSPVELVVGSLRLFGVPSVNRTVLASLVRMGQTLFYPPDVKGWDGGSAWLNSQTVLTRENFASALVGDPQTMQRGLLASSFGTDPRALARTLTSSMLQGDVSPAALDQLVAYLGGSGTEALGTLSGENFQERIRGAAYLTMAMPAYQLN